MKLTLGMPAYKNYTEVFFTVQSLRMHHNLKDTEILVVDNFGDPQLEAFCKNQGGGIVRYEKYTGIVGTSDVRNQVFELGKGEMIACMDSHVLFKPGSFDEIPQTDDLVQGPLMYDDMKNYSFEWKPVWRGQMWGVWGDCLTIDKMPTEPVEIWGMGLGFFMCSKKGWLGFCKKCKGFGGEEGTIHEKFRKAGKKCWCYPKMVWGHLFGRPIPYPLQMIDRVTNYIVGFEEIGLDTSPILEHFGKEMFDKAMIEAKQR